MAQKNPFLKYLIKDKKEDVFHSSAYAKAQSGASIGAASTESYQVRVNVSQNRQRVRGYSNSDIMANAGGGMRKAEVYKPPIGNNTFGVNSGAGGVSAGRAPMMPKNPGISIKKQA